MLTPIIQATPGGELVVVNGDWREPAELPAFAECAWCLGVAEADGGGGLWAVVATQQLARPQIFFCPECLAPVLERLRPTRPESVE